MTAGQLSVLLDRIRWSRPRSPRSLANRPLACGSGPRGWSRCRRRWRRGAGPWRPTSRRPGSATRHGACRHRAGLSAAARGRAMPNQRHDHPLPPIAWIAACNPAEGTFAAEAVSGTYYHITCLGCRREVVRSARQFCVGGAGVVLVAGCHSRLECSACGHLVPVSWSAGIGQALGSTARRTGQRPSRQGCWAMAHRDSQKKLHHALMTSALLAWIGWDVYATEPSSRHGGAVPVAFLLAQPDVPRRLPRSRAGCVVKMRRQARHHRPAAPDADQNALATCDWRRGERYAADGHTWRHCAAGLDP
jgi:hypothetical protein